MHSARWRPAGGDASEHANPDQSSCRLPSNDIALRIAQRPCLRTTGKSRKQRSQFSVFVNENNYVAALAFRTRMLFLSAQVAVDQMRADNGWF